jgi:hypothetical protein
MWYYINNCSLDYTSADVFLVGNLSQYQGFSFRAATLKVFRVIW